MPKKFRYSQISSIYEQDQANPEMRFHSKLVSGLYDCLFWLNAPNTLLCLTYPR